MSDAIVGVCYNYSSVSDDLARSHIPICRIVAVVTWVDSQAQVFFDNSTTIT